MSSQHPDNDWQLLQEVDDAASGLEILFDRHKDYVFRLAWGFLGTREGAEDVTQEVFLRLAKGRRRFRPRGQLRTLLYQIALNTCREQLRGRGREARFTFDLDDPRSNSDRSVGSVSEVATRGLFLRDVWRGLGELSRRQREAVVLRLVQGCDTREAAQVMRCREGTVKIHLHRALEALRGKLGVGEGAEAASALAKKSTLSRTDSKTNTGTAT